MRNLIYYFIILTTLFSCDKKQENKNEFVVENKISNTQRHFKIDSSNFEISLRDNIMDIAFEPEENFESQLKKMTSIFEMISIEKKFRKIEKVIIFPTNNELLKDMALVPEIQKDLIRSENGNGIVNSMGIVSKYAKNSKLLTQITDIFLQNDCICNHFYIDKCHQFKIKSDSNHLTMNCTSVCFNITNFGD